MNTRLRFPLWKMIVGSILMVVLVSLVWMLSMGVVWGQQPQSVGAAFAALSSGQVAAIEGGYLLLAEPPPDFFYLPVVLKGP